MESVFSVESLVLALENGGALWVLAVPEVMQYVTKNAEQFWEVDANKNATVACCHGLVSQGMLEQDEPVDFAQKAKEAVDGMAQGIQKLWGLRRAKAPVDEYKALTEFGQLCNLKKHNSFA